MNELFDIRRLALLLRADAISGYRKLLIVSLAIAGAMMSSTLLLQGMFGTTLGSRWWFVALLFLWGFMLSSRSFPELHDKTRNEVYLLLPASALEKTLARLLIATVGFVPYLLLFTTVVGLSTQAVGTLLFDRSPALLQLPSSSLWSFIGYYIAGQSVYFLGGAWFRKSHFSKTLIVLFLGSIVLAGLSVLIFRVVLGPFSAVPVAGDFTPLWQGIEATLKIALFFLIPVFCWTVAWLRVRETQASHGI